MKHTKKVSVPAKTETEVDHWTCDLCGAKTVYKDRWPPLDTRYDRNETTLEFKTGSVYPDGGHLYTTTVDICPKCFADKLVPWLESQGAKPRGFEKVW